MPSRESRPTQQERAAASWLLLAYSLNHPVDCDCKKCESARTVLEAAWRRRTGEDAA